MGERHLSKEGWGKYVPIRSCRGRWGNVEAGQVEGESSRHGDMVRLGHRDVSTTMIYTHVLNREGRGVRSPADGLMGGSPWQV